MCDIEHLQKCCSNAGSCISQDDRETYAMFCDAEAVQIGNRLKKTEYDKDMNWQNQTELAMTEELRGMGIIRQ